MPGHTGRRAVLVCFVGLLAIPSARGQVDVKAARFPTKLGLEKTWDEFKSKPITPAAAGAILREDLTGSFLIRWADSRYLSLWNSVDRKLAADAEALSALRAAQEPQAQGLAAQADDVDRLMTVVRRFPYAPSVQQALLKAGSKELRRGNFHLAARCFRDVLARSDDPELRGHAQVGIWLVAANDPNPSALEAAFQGIDAKTPFPWLGDKLPASAIRERLSAATSAQKADLKSLPLKMLDAPGAVAGYDWPAASADGVAVSGPSALSWFDGIQSRPLWTQSHPPLANRETLAALVPGPHVPGVGGGKAFSRWGMQSISLLVYLVPRPPAPPTTHATINVAVNVAAFDVRTGVQVWSTSANRDWQDVCPASDPVYADGRLYLLAASRSLEYSPIYLTCLSADDGAILWKRELVTSHTTSAATPKRVDVVHSGNQVAVVGGSVYCSTNAGVVACCDVRDGLIEWVRTYPRDVAGGAQRPGAAPVVVGSKVMFMPRDAGIAFGVDAASGDFAWLNTKESASQSVAGVFENLAFLVSSNRVAAIEVDTGKIKWERDFPAAIDARVAVSGANVLAATRTTLYRLDARSGEIVEQAPATWAKSPVSLLAKSGTLFGIVPVERVVAAKAVEPNEPPVLSSSAARVVHRSPQALQIDGQTFEWDKFVTEPAGAKGKLLLSHDDKNLYIGATCPGADLAGSRLEMASTGGKRWIVNGQGIWEGVNTEVPIGAKAAASQNVSQGTLTYEVAIPLESLLPARGSKSSWGRLNLELSLRQPDPKAGTFRTNDTVFLHRLTRDQEAAELQLAAALPSLEASWKALEQSWRARTAGATTTANLYRSAIKNQPKSPDVGRMLVQLDLSLRNGFATDPMDEVLRFAQEAGVPDAARAAYKRIASAYVSQWLYVDEKAKPQVLELRFQGSKSFQNRVVAHAKSTDVPLPPQGAWHEWRLPLLALGLHDQPIRGLAFQQIGSGRVYWDRAALVIDGKEIPLLPDDLSKEQVLGKWEWVAEPGRNGRKAHTMRPPVGNDSARHAVTLKNGVTAHLGAVQPKTADPALVASLTEHLPRLAYDSFAEAAYDLVDAVSSPEARSKLRQSILEKADRESAGKWLEVFVECEVEAGNPEPRKTVEALGVASRLPESVLGPFRELSKFAVRSWYVIGPFPGSHAGADPALESEPVQLSKEYAGVGGKVSWKPWPALGERNDLKKLFGDSSGAAYAMCLINSDSKQSALLKLDADDNVQIWQKHKNTLIRPVFDGPFFTGDSGATSRFVPIELMPGWNQLLLRVESHAGRWGFALELRDRDGGAALEGLLIQRMSGK